MRNRLYGGVRGRKMKVGGNYFIFLLLDFKQVRITFHFSLSSSLTSDFIIVSVSFYSYVLTTR